MLLKLFQVVILELLKINYNLKNGFNMYQLKYILNNQSLKMIFDDFISVQSFILVNNISDFKVSKIKIKG